MRRNVKLGHPTFQGQTRCRKTLGQQIATYDKHTIAIATVGQSQARLTTLFPPNYSHIISHINETSCSNYNAERRTNNPKPPTPTLQKQMPARLARHHLHQANKKHQFPLQPGQEGRRQPGKLHKRTHLPHHCPLQLLHLLQVQPRLLRYKAKDPSKHIVKAKLFMFDAFSEKDIQIQISIPGSMEVKCFNLRGETLSFNAGDYERAYYSSFLRSLYPMNYPGIILYHLINRIEILKPIIKNFIAFAARHELRELNNQLQPQRRIEFEEGEQSRNLSLQILVKYLIQNGFGNLLKVVMDELKKQKSQKYYQIEMEWKLKEKKYTQILYKTAQKLLINPHINQLKEFQIKALNRVGKSLQIAFIGRTLIESGGTNDQISSIILRSLIETNQDKRYLKSLNLLLNFSNSQQRKLLQVSHIHKNNSTIRFGEQMKNIKCISECSELCFPFDNAFLNRTSEFLGKRDILQKNSKEGFTYNIIQKVEESLENNPVFYETLIYYVKQRGWANLVKIRANCFWLESDFHIQSESLRNKHFHSKFDDNYSFFQRNFQKEQQMEEADVQVPSSEERQEQINQLQHQSAKLDNIEDNNSDFEGNLSQHEFSKEIQEPPKCSARVNLNIKFNQQERKGENKIQCCLQMQQLFFALYHDLKLQNSLESWQQRLKQADDSTLSPIKKEIAALIYLKKGFLNRKLLQSRKCEQAFRSVKKLTQSFSLNLVATYQLILLYIQKKNVKGVEFYLVELVKVLKNMGIDTFDVVPEWAKPILQFIVDHQGLSIVKNIHPVFKYVFGFYLRSNLSEQEVNEVLKIKK